MNVENIPQEIQDELLGGFFPLAALHGGFIGPVQIVGVAENPSYVIIIHRDNRPCSVLEMMTALAIRCEEHIMDDPDIGNRTGQWFWSMLANLGLGSMYDAKFDRRYVDRILERFLNREYECNGEGGLFTVNNGRDMRKTEIWYQMNYYLSEIIREEGV